MMNFSSLILNESKEARGTKFWNDLKMMQERKMK